jgi:low affinity Fe/Cu permease
MKLTRGFTAFASKVARAAGRPSTVVLCLVVVSAWGISGPFFRFSDTWQLVINSISSVVTLVMAFLIQNTQNRDGAAIQAKLDEIIRSSAAHNRYIGIESLTEDELDSLREHCVRRARGENVAEAIMAADQAEHRANVKAAQAAERAGTG